MDIFKEYEVFEVKFKKMEEERKALRDRVLVEMTVLGETKHTGSKGTFSVTNKPVWIYTEKIKEMEEKVKVAKHKEEETGKAQKKLSTYITYSTKKNNE